MEELERTVPGARGTGVVLIFLGPFDQHWRGGGLKPGDGWAQLGGKPHVGDGGVLRGWSVPNVAVSPSREYVN